MRRRRCTAKSRGRKSGRESLEERDLRSLLTRHQQLLKKDDGKDVVVVAVYYIKKTLFREHTTIR